MVLVPGSDHNPLFDTVSEDISIERIPRWSNAGRDLLDARSQYYFNRVILYDSNTDSEDVQ